MALSTEDRTKIWRGLMRYWSSLLQTILNMSKQNIMDAVIAADDWIEANQASYNSALPRPFRSNATADQKTLLFCAVAVARVSIQFARQLFGEVD